ASHRGHVRPRGPRVEPPRDAVVARHPLLEEHGLPVPRAGDEHPDPRRRVIQGMAEPWALDDPAPADRRLRLPWLVRHRDRCADATPLPSVRKAGARGRPVRAAGAGRQRLRGGRSLTRAGTYGSSPVSRRNAAGICRRRGTPSFTRSASLCARAVRAEIPRERPTSSFEHPAAISATTSRCRSVCCACVTLVVLFIPRFFRPPFGGSIRPGV